MVVVPPTHLPVRGAALVKSAREQLDIVNAYAELGSYRAAAELCGTTHKTVRRIIERALLHLVSSRHGEVEIRFWRKIAKASSSNATASRKVAGSSTGAPVNG